MAETTKTLRLTYLNSDNKKVNLTLSKSADNLTPDTVRGLMKQIADSHAFDKEGVDIYHEPQSAAYVERTVTGIFDDAKTAAGEQA
ncbi:MULTISPECIES: DUF2922 domain-containing protein [Lactobacillus]|uniref:DUF2922 domain-containing protein n=1 Tax=Lactobacillus xujianguonis TaxID=2495899 RepID=A0A437SSJ3_9LACO|nr:MULTISPECIES: DUF2922 domain-containing protein [Lactobacillus]RVU69855.1 DUF2922 domain-containing protein [Lactobacillus xujianguonis]RVU72084.1 DUF2922 domain-containing protein [Lactobacillus xujianguonis]